MAHNPLDSLIDIYIEEGMREKEALNQVKEDALKGKELRQESEVVVELPALDLMMLVLFLEDMDDNFELNEDLEDNDYLQGLIDELERQADMDLNKSAWSETLSEDDFVSSMLPMSFCRRLLEKYSELKEE